MLIKRHATDSKHKLTCFVTKQIQMIMTLRYNGRYKIKSLFPLVSQFEVLLKIITIIHTVIATDSNSR